MRIGLSGRVVIFTFMDSTPVKIHISESIGSVSSRTIIGEGATAIMVLAHGAGAGMDHRFMEQLAMSLWDCSIASIRFNFPFTENKKGRPDVPAIAEKTISVMLDYARENHPDLPLIVGGKSFGGRMTSQLLSKSSTNAPKGIVFYGFPLHAPGQPGTARAEHLKSVRIPMLFLQGTRDALAQLSLMQSVCSVLPLATLQTFEGADHSFKSGKREFIPELVASTQAWVNQL